MQLPTESSVYCAIDPDAFGILLRNLIENAAKYGGGSVFVTIDPDEAPRPGDFVVASNGSEEATFKKYRPRGIDENGQEVFELVPLNDDFPTLHSDRQQIAIIGVIPEPAASARESPCRSACG